MIFIPSDGPEMENLDTLMSEAAGGRCDFVYHFYTDDMIRDKVIYSLEVYSDELPGDQTYTSDGIPVAEIQRFWKNGYKKNSEQLIKYKIEQSDAFTLDAFPVKVNGDEITYMLNVKTVNF